MIQNFQVAKEKSKAKYKGNNKGKNYSYKEASTSNPNALFVAVMVKEKQCFAKKRASKATKEEVTSKSNNKDKKEESKAKVAYVAKSCSSPSTISATHAQSFVVISQPMTQDQTLSR